MKEKVNVVEVASVNKVLDNLLRNYKSVYENGGMEFYEYAIVENVMLKLNVSLKDCGVFEVEREVKEG